jgi:EAL domain-containing protein (putative c-di-GMP-specific phosphodiesterase class I)/CheY-like chemotaxis protein
VVESAPSGTVLLVRDERVGISFMRPLLGAGYRVVLVDTAKALVDEALKGPFDVVVCDGALDGAMEALSVVKAYEPNLAMIVVANPDDFDGSFAPFARIDEPVDPRPLLETVAAGIERKRGILSAREARRALEVRPTEPAMQRPVSATRRKVDGARVQATLEEFDVDFDPIFDLEALRTAAYEANAHEEEALTKLRALHPPPPEPEQLVRRHVRARVAAALDAIPTPARVFVDVLREDMFDPELYDANAPLSRVAERVVLQLRGVERTADLGARLSVLRFLGFRIAIGDKDAGALSALAELAPDYLKLSPSVTRGIDHDPARRKVVEGLVGMCRTLGTIPVAESVKCAKERTALLEVGCALVQAQHPTTRAA